MSVDRSKILSLVQELSNTLEKLNSTQNELKKSEEEKYNLKNSLEKQKSMIERHQRTLEEVTEEGEKARKDLLQRNQKLDDYIGKIQKKKENAINSLSQCQKELVSLNISHEQLQSEYAKLKLIIDEQQVVQQEIVSARDENKAPSLNQAETTNITRVEQALIEIKEQIKNCCEIYKANV